MPSRGSRGLLCGSVTIFYPDVVDQIISFHATDEACGTNVTIVSQLWSANPHGGHVAVHVWLSVHRPSHAALPHLWQCSENGQVSPLRCHACGLMEVSMRLTERDIQILQKVNECLWLSTTQLKRYFFPSTTLYAVNKRLKILADQGYLACKRLSKTEEYHFRVGITGKSVLIEWTGMDSRDIVIPRQFPAQLKHFSTLNDLRWFCETAIQNIRGQLHFFLMDRDIKRLLPDSRVVPDALFRFAIPLQGNLKEYLVAVEYDAGTENPQYFGRDKIKKYVQAMVEDYSIFARPDLHVVTFADTRKRIVQLIRHSIKFMHSDMNFLFVSMDDLVEKGDLFANIFVNPHHLENSNGTILCSLIE